MRILYISPTYYPRIGGVEYVVKSVAERLAKAGHEVAVLTGEPGIGKPIEEEVNGVRVIRWPTWTPGGAYHIPRQRSRLESALRELLRGVDVVHLHSVHAVLPVWVGLRLRELGFSGRVVVTPYYHGSGHTFFRRILWALWRPVIGRLLRSVDVVTTVSRLEAQLVEGHFGVRAIVIENGVDEAILGYEWRPAGYAMYSGRIERYKNVHRLANIVGTLNKRYGLGLKLKVFGEGPYKDELLRALRGVEVEFEVGSFQPFERYLESLSSATFFGLLSERESYPQSVNEANAIGVPVVVAKPWGENFSDRSRTLIVDLSEGDERIAEEILRLLEEAPKQPKPRVPTWSEVTPRYLSVYEGRGEP